MSRKREAVFMGVGVLAGLALCGPASAAVQQLTTTPTTQSFCVDGQRVSMTAYSSGGPYGVSNTNCAGWAVLCSDAVFGNLPWRRIDRPSWNQLRPGDLVEYDDTISRHVVVVSKKAGYIMVTESGTDQQVLWSGQYFRWWLEQQPHYISYTRYPQ